MLFWLVFLPLIGGFASWLFEVVMCRSFTQPSECKIDNKNTLLSRFKAELNCYGANWVALIVMLTTLGLVVVLGVDSITAFYVDEPWQKIVAFEWIPLLGIEFKLLLDGFSLLLIALTTVITTIAIIYSRKESQSHSGLFYFCILFMTSAVIMLFATINLFLFFFLWEAISIPIYFLITLWGRRDSNAQLRINGASKFLIFTQISGLLMLISIVSLALANWKITNQWTFDYYVLMKTPISSFLEFLLMLGFLAAFIVRVPLVPFHSWFIDAHIESSTTGSIMISGLVVNTAVYGFLRFVIPLFPNASLTIMPFMMVIAIFSLFYATLLCFNQNDIKRLIAYAHIALMGFTITIIYSGSLMAYQGVILQIIAVSLVIVGLFIISGLLVERYFTRNISQFFGLKNHVKYLSTLTLFFLLATLGVPGTANFVGNFMMLLGSYESSAYITVLLVLGLMLLSIAIIIRMQPIFYGVVEKPLLVKKPVSLKDLSLLIFILLILFFIGLYPQWVLDMAQPAIGKIQQIINSAQTDLIKGDV